jgi:hypothetical protein
MHENNTIRTENRNEDTMTTPADQTKDVVTTIATQLGETEPQPIGTIHRIVKRLGTETALAFLAETQQLEAQGGLMLPDGSRRRTPGGVFFYLVKQRISTKDKLRIFYPLNKQRQVTPAEEEKPHYTDGEVRKVKLTGVGRPGPTTMQGGYVITTLPARPAPPLPKGLPAFPAQPTTYTLYLPTTQWQKLAEALTDPEDALIFEGVPTVDTTQQGILVYVTMATTKKREAAKRQAQQESSAR